MRQLVWPETTLFLLWQVIRVDSQTAVGNQAVPDASTKGKLKPNSLGVLGILFFVLSAQAPLTGVAGAVPLSVALGNGPGAPATYVAAGVITLLFSVGFVAMGRHVVNAGAFYTYIGKGLGRHVGTGSAGVAQTFLALGLIYFLVMIAAAFSYRVPPPGWKPAGWTPPDEAHSERKMISRQHVHIDEALKTRQFYQLWIVLCLNVTAGIGVLSVARTMMTEIFGTALPGIVDGAFAATYVMMISVFNMLGRFVWASASDYIGRRNTYWIFLALGILLYLSIPYTAQQVSASPAVIWLVYFYAATMIIFTMYGGGFATIPAYIADVFGTRYVGGIHGRILTAWSVAGLLGPLAITSLRDQAIGNAVRDLAARVDPQRFAQTFGAGLEQLEALVAERTVTIAKLMEIAPPGTIDPTSSLYNTTMYLMAALLAIALVANATMKPVDHRHHMQAAEAEGAEPARAEGAAPRRKSTAGPAPAGADV